VACATDANTPFLHYAESNDLNRHKAIGNTKAIRCSRQIMAALSLFKINISPFHRPVWAVAEWPLSIVDQTFTGNW
jgi:hypothetical protein